MHKQDPKHSPARICDQVLNNGLRTASKILLNDTPVWSQNTKFDHTCAPENNDIIFAFNTSLDGLHARNTDAPDGWTQDDGSTCDPAEKLGPQCQVCRTGAYVDSDALCPDDAVCVDGECLTKDTSGSGCMKNSDCKTLAPDTCANDPCFCDFGNSGNGVISFEQGPNGKLGTCLPATDYTRLTIRNNGIAGIISNEKLNWYSAKNFCQANGKRLPRLSPFHVDLSKLGAYYEEDGSCYDRGAQACENLEHFAQYSIPNNYGFWTGNISNSSGLAYTISIARRAIFVPGRAYKTVYALCE